MQGFCVGMQTQTSNDQENEIKEDLYMQYLELKEELTSKNIEMSKKQISETANTTSDKYKIFEKRRKRNKN